MLNDINLRELAELSSAERAFLSVYLSTPTSWDKLQKKLSNIRSLLSENPDELEQFENNVRMIDDYLDKNSYQSESLCVFSCWLLDYLQTYELNLSVDDRIHVGPAPYIRPLAELKDEYENYAVVLADNKSAKIYLVTSAKAEEEARIRGNIKNHVKVGGWSQQRYERRRDKELLHYAREIIDALSELDKRREFDRIILAGSEETINEIRRNLPEPLEKQVIGEKSLDLDEDKEYIDQEIFELFVKQEREEEKVLWNEIKNRYLAGGLAQVGVKDVLAALKMGRVREVIVNRNAEIGGTRCRECKNVFNGDLEKCAICGSESVFAVDLVNEIVELVKLTSAKIEFADDIQGLKDVGDVAALLRY